MQGRHRGREPDEPHPRCHTEQMLTHLERAVQVTVHFDLPQGLGLRAEQGGPESVTGEAFLRHLWVGRRGRGHQAAGSGDNRDIAREDHAGLLWC